MKIFYHGDMDGITAAYLYRNYRREGLFFDEILDQAAGGNHE